MFKSTRHKPLISIGLTVFGLTAIALAGFGQVVAAIAPLALLVSALLSGYYPGERVLARLIERSNNQADFEPASDRPKRPSCPMVVPPRGTKLLAESLSGRGPPAWA